MTTCSVRRALQWCSALAIGLAAAQAQASVQGIWGRTSGCPAPATRCYDLVATDGYIIAADGVSIYMWGYGEAAKGTMQYTAPTLLANAGDTIAVTLTNKLPVRSSILFPGQAAVTGSGGSTTPGLLVANEVAPVPGQTVTYQFTAAQPGTYLYQSGTQPALQVEMGMVGALVIYPVGVYDSTGARTANPAQAYNHAGTAYDRETLFVVTEADSDLHQLVAESVQGLQGNACLSSDAGCTVGVDLTRRFPKYWFLNGRTAPDTLAANGAQELPLQPYNALPRVHPGERALLRMVGAGSDLHPMHHHGNNSWAIARDGRMLTSDPALGPNMALSDYTIQVVPGETYDAIWSWTGAGLNWDVSGCVGTPATCPSDTQLESDRGKPIPVKLPSELELAYGEFYSGSPFLGSFGVRPVGAGFANTTGAYFHMFHSHNEREVVNGGIYPGGMMTMLVIEPKTQVIVD